MSDTPQPSAVERLKEVRAKLRLARAERSLALCEMQQKRLAESNVLWDAVGAYGDLLDRLKTDDGRLLLAPSTVADRRYGANWPHWRTWHEHSILRAQSRFLVDTSDLAFGALAGLTSYVVGDGMTHLAVPRKGRDAPPSLVDAVNEFIERFSRLNELPSLEQEEFKSSRTDGEAFGRDFVGEDGMTHCRVVLPEQVLEDPSEPLETGSFGIRNPRGDVQTAEAYYVCYDGLQSEGEWVDAAEMTHIKCNVSRTIKRGMPDFCYETHEALRTSGKCVRNMVEGAAIQAAIAEIRQHDGATAAQAQAFADELADFQTTEPASGRQTNNTRVLPGTTRDIPKGMNYVPPPFSNGGAVWIQIVQAALRKCGVRWNAPEWLTSGDASNGNYSSALVAESPFNRRCKRWQGFYSRPWNRRVERAVRAACDAGAIRAEGRAWSWREVTAVLTVTTKAPALESRDPLQVAQERQVRMQAGVLSPQTWSQEDGVDYDQEQSNLEAHAERTGQAPGTMGGATGAMGGVPDDVGGAGDPAAGDADPFAGLDDRPSMPGAEDGNTLRATVGGSQAIADLQRAVYAGELPREAAVANATIVFGFSPEEAEALFPEAPPRRTADDSGGMQESRGWAGFTGRKQDKLGRTRCYTGGRPTRCGTGQHSGGRGDRAHQAAREHLRRLMSRPQDAQPGDVARAAKAISRLTVAEAKALRRELGLEAKGGKRQHAEAIAADAARVLKDREALRREARAAGVNPDELAETSDQIWRQQKEWRAQVQAMLSDTRDLYRSRAGVSLTRNHRAFDGGDPQQIEHFDLISRTVANRYPGILGDDPEEAGQRLYDFLAAGVPEYRRSDARRAALGHLTARRDEVPF